MTSTSSSTASINDSTDRNNSENSSPDVNPINNNNNNVHNNNKTVSSERAQEELKWREAVRKARERGEDECPICMGPMEAVDIDGMECSTAVAEDASNSWRAGVRANWKHNAGEILPLQLEGDLKRNGREGLGNGGGRGERAQGRGGGGTGGLEGGRGGEGGEGGAADKDAKTRDGRFDAAAETSGRDHQRRDGNGGEQRARLLLSCSHVFHKAVSYIGGMGATPWGPCWWEGKGLVFCILSAVGSLATLLIMRQICFSRPGNSKCAGGRGIWVEEHFGRGPVESVDAFPGHVYEADGCTP